MTFKVREANLADLESLVSFIMAEAAEAEGRQLSPGAVRAGVRAGLENPDVARYWVLENDQAGVIASISIVREWSDWHASDYWWIQSLFIKPDYRGQGFLRHLLKVVRMKARLEDVVELKLYVHQDNRRAIAAYEKAGFLESPHKIMTMSP